jgi:hypothetical protein
VLEIECKASEMFMRVLADDGITPILQSARAFTMVDATIPKLWDIRADAADPLVLTLGPRAWTNAFWGRFFESDDESRAVFERVSYEMRST